MARIAWFKELHKSDTDVAGGKGANLGELENGGFAVPAGFVITAEAYLAAIEAAGLRRGLSDALASIDVDDQSAVAEVSERLRESIRSAPIPAELAAEVLGAYHQLGRDALVAVRSSATTEDLEGVSFAGMNQTFTNVAGDDALLGRARDCWASMFGDRVIAYRATQGITEEPAIAVIVQEMLRPDASGVIFTADPSSGDRSRIVIEAGFGQGEVVVGGQVEPDTYVLSKTGPAILEVHVGLKTHKIVRGANGDERVELGPEEGSARVLSDEQVLDLARLALRVEDHYGEPQDMEFAVDDGRVWLVQSRPITTLGEAPAGSGAVSGLGASPGVVAGRVRVLESPKDGGQLEAGEVLVAKMTNPDWIPTIRRAAALVTDGGGTTCHAAIVARELGVPCVVGTRRATTVLRTGEWSPSTGARAKCMRANASRPPPPRPQWPQHQLARRGT